MHEIHQTGLVAYFDILGFKTIASDADIGKAAGLIDSVLLRVPTEVTNKTKAELGHYTPPGVIVFADSILLWQPIPDAERAQAYWWFYFFLHCANLMAEMFNNGLPLRGAISEGTFFIKEHSFVGKPIVDCHDLASSAEWAGCVLVPEAREKLEKMWLNGSTHKDIMEQVYVQYPVPFKRTDQRTNHIVIKWFFKNRWKPHTTEDRIADKVNSAFTAHGKILCPDAILKAQNTEDFLKFIDSLYVNSNQPMPGK